jgi:hypothetical protein
MTINQLYADLYHRQIYSLERYIGPTIISRQNSHSFVEIFVYFFESPPRSDLELVFKDEAGVEYKSRKFKEGVLIRWNFDTLVHPQYHHSHN